ncbi:MAG: hypothetical protein ABSE63_00650 [Thermoguttaceae bacterium]|jgi:hypothetical protein
MGRPSIGKKYFAEQYRQTMNGKREYSSAIKIKYCQYDPYEYHREIATPIKLFSEISEGIARKL